MKQNKPILLPIFLGLLLVLSLGWMTACDNNSGNASSTETEVESQTSTETESETDTLNQVTYTVNVVDGAGEAMTNNLIVTVKKDGETVAQQPYRGSPLIFELPSGTYRVELDLMGASFDYDADACVMDESHTALTIQLFSVLSDRTTELYFSYPLDKEYPAYFIGEGVTRIPLTVGDYTFLVFQPTASAIYNVECVDGSQTAISYHGSTFFAQGTDLSEDNKEIIRLENGLAVYVYGGNIGSAYVLGLKAETAEECLISITNAGIPPLRVEDMPWSTYLEDSAKVQEHLAYKPEGAYTTVDVTDLSLKAVFNEADGYYHLGAADGPVLFIDLTSGNRFIAGITEICRKQGMGVYLYDDNGNVVEKRSYTELFIQYGLVIDETESAGNIKVPLTAKLAEAIQAFGNQMNWWAEDSSQNIFYNGESALLPAEKLNTEFAWLLFCGYYA